MTRVYVQCLKSFIVALDSYVGSRCRRFRVVGSVSAAPALSGDMHALRTLYFNNFHTHNFAMAVKGLGKVDQEYDGMYHACTRR